MEFLALIGWWESCTKLSVRYVKVCKH